MLYQTIHIIILLFFVASFENQMPLENIIIYLVGAYMVIWWCLKAESPDFYYLLNYQKDKNLYQVIYKWMCMTYMIVLLLNYIEMDVHDCVICSIIY